jgi:uncharacterized membrane protein (UPF0127 family)
MSTSGPLTLLIEHAQRWHQRMLGLMFRPTLAAGHALLLTPCPSVHTAFMRFAIDVVYLDDTYMVLAMHLQLRPWRMSFGPRGTRHTQNTAQMTLKPPLC